LKQYLYALSPTIPVEKQLLFNALYDETGNVVTIVDPKGNATGIQFSSVTGFAWPGTVVNALGHSVQTTYDLGTGTAATFTDANNHTTTYNRNGDLLDRISSVVFPGGGLTEFKYCDEGSTQACESAMALNSIRKKVKQDSCGTNTIVAVSTR